MATRRDFLKTSAPLAAAGLAGCRGGAQRPNVLYIITDDQRWDLLSLMGHPYLKTPGMDRIGREGVLFENAFVTTSLCSPSRASFLTGQYAHQHKVQYNRSSEYFENNAVTFPMVLRQAGYYTGYAGKWHIGRDSSPRPGFDSWCVLPGQGRYYNPLMNVNGDEREIPGHVDDVVGDYAVDFLKEAAGRSEPFCLCTGFKSPHAEQLPAERLKSVFQDIEIPTPPSWNEDYSKSRKSKWVRDAWIHADKFFDGPDQLKGGWQDFIKDFYRCIMSADENVGKILKALDELGQAENTLVIFVGDNGFFLGEHHLVDKRFPYEESLRIPMLVRWPARIRAGQKLSRMVLNIDVCPTILDACGAAVPDGVMGRSMMPLLEGAPPADWRTEMFYEYAERIWEHPAILAVRTETHKYIEYIDPTDTHELYDLVKDPQEMTNVIDDAAYASVLADMKQRLERLKQETGWAPPVQQGPNEPPSFYRDKPVTQGGKVVRR
jgi:N-acetylglucosamine-6-sulfatase